MTIMKHFEPGMVSSGHGLRQACTQDELEDSPVMCALNGSPKAGRFQVQMGRTLWVPTRRGASSKRSTLPALRVAVLVSPARTHVNAVRHDNEPACQSGGAQNLTDPDDRYIPLRTK